MSAIENKQLQISRILPVIPAVLVLAYCLWYWTRSHAGLAQFYLDLNPAFYKAGAWGNFFTEGIKKTGQLVVRAGIGGLRLSEPAMVAADALPPAQAPF